MRALRCLNGRWLVFGRTGRYLVFVKKGLGKFGFWFCDCPDYHYRVLSGKKETCKHINFVRGK